MFLNKTILLALALIPLAIPAASAGPIVCLGTGCPGAIGMCLDDPGVADLEAFAECAGVPAVPTLDCPAVYYYVDADVVAVGYGPCTNVDIFVNGENVLP